MIDRRKNTPIVFRKSVMVLLFIGIMSMMFIKPLHTSAFFMLNQAEAPKEVDAYELIVDGETWFFLEDVKLITQALDRFKYKMTPEINDNTIILEAKFVQHIEIVPVKVEQSKLNIVDNLTRKLNHQIQAQENYIVLQGDNVWKISEKIGMSMEEMDKLNPDIEHKVLQPNDEIVVSSVQYYLDVDVTLQAKAEEVIRYETNTVKDASLTKDAKVVSKQGVDGLKEVTYIFEYKNGVEQSNSVIAETVLVEPITAEVKLGTKPVVVAVKSSGSSSGKSFGVVTTGSLSSDYGWRIHPISGKRSFHDGIDISNKVGTSVNSYKDGTVTKVGWTDSYGNYIIVDHGGGLTTYYIHLSAFDVSEGDSVSTGQLIGRMGKTGSATGSHLQFEVRLNGTPQNPWDYL